MDGLIGTIIAGVVVTVIGAILAFYFGGVRERQKRGYERQREEQRQLEERQEEQLRRKAEQQEELNQRRAEALDDIRLHAFSFANAFRTWTANAANLEVPPKGEDEQAEEFSKRLAELIQQADEVSTKLVSLRGHYDAHRPILEQKPRNIIESFERQGIERHSFLSKQMNTTATSLQQYLALLQESKVAGALLLTGGPLTLGLPGLRVIPRAIPRAKELWNAHMKKEEILEKHRQEVLQAAEFATDWDIQADLRALDAEVERIAGLRS